MGSREALPRAAWWLSKGSIIMERRRLNHSGYYSGRQTECAERIRQNAYAAESGTNSKGAARSEPYGKKESSVKVTKKLEVINSSRSLVISLLLCGQRWQNLKWIFPSSSLYECVQCWNLRLNWTFSFPSIRWLSELRKICTLKLVRQWEQSTKEWRIRGGRQRNRNCNYAGRL